MKKKRVKTYQKVLAILAAASMIMIIAGIVFPFVLSTNSIPLIGIILTMGALFLVLFFVLNYLICKLL